MDGDFRVETYDFLLPKVNEIMQRAASLDEARQRIASLRSAVYTLPLSTTRTVVILADDAGSMHTT